MVSGRCVNFQIFQNGRHFKMAAVQRGVPPINFDRLYLKNYGAKFDETWYAGRASLVLQIYEKKSNASGSVWRPF